MKKNAGICIINNIEFMYKYSICIWVDDEYTDIDEVLWRLCVYPNRERILNE